MDDLATHPINQRQELGAFLVSRRARIKPKDIGLPEGRRRTAGLRREEVALLAGVSVSWYTWLEQGRDIRVSPAVLERISEVLRLSRVEVVHLFTLADELAPPDRHTNGVTDNLRLMVDAIEPYPAYIRNGHWDILAWNSACAELFTDFGAFEPHERNTLRLIFVHAADQSLAVNWEVMARNSMEFFRIARAMAVDKKPFDDLIAELCTLSPKFREWWPQQDVTILSEGVERLQHPTRGPLDVSYVVLTPEGRPDLSLITFIPAPSKPLQAG